MLDPDRPLWDSDEALWLSYERRIGRPSAEAQGRFPDFLVISPPRTGTTWLFENLRRHPGIFLPDQKELRYFDLRWINHPIDWYLGQFPGDNRLRGDATPSYALLPEAAIRLIHAFSPQLKLVFLMREPVARAWSQAKHNYTYGEANFTVDRPDRFDQVDDRRLVANFIHDYPLSAGDYAGALRRWLRHFPRSQIHVAFLEDFQKNPEQELRSVLSFLGADATLDLSDYPLDTKINEGSPAVLPPTLRSMLQELYGPRTVAMARFLKETFGKDPPWHLPAPSQPQPIWLKDRSDGLRLYLFDGEFCAAPITADGRGNTGSIGKHRRGGPGRHAPFLFDLERRLSTSNKRAAESTEEESRLQCILTGLARVRRSTLEGVVDSIESTLLKDRFAGIVAALTEQVNGAAKSLYVQGQNIEVVRQTLEALISRHDGEMRKADGALTQLNARIDAVEQGAPVIAERVAALESKLTAFERTLSAVQSSLQDTAAALQQKFQDGIDSQKAFLEQQHAATAAQAAQMMKALEREQGVLVRHRDGAALALSQLRAEVATRVGEARETLAGLQRQAGANQDAAQAQLDAFASRLALLHDAVERNASALEQLRAGSIRRIFAFLRPARE